MDYMNTNENETQLCIKCNKRPIQNKHFKLCSECNFERTHNGKTRFDIYREKNLEKQKKKVYKPLKRKPIKYKRKKTGERETFLEIWEERPHKCVKCNEPLGDEPLAQFFSHIKPKSTHSELRLVKSNIELLCFKCHYKEEFQ